ncbi:hypothetical protein G1C96_1060 [Bifidobacterium sp. DSM 109958]|uniref:Uncharacterized protein n=2 Tax=Bifidobacterium moraviense TaxID=2675323 RepID=A0A7Y0F1W2_9BIFI|nr:hypothetical protein [Bifidobacterium sp. DSM 109958]
MFVFRSNDVMLVMFMTVIVAHIFAYIVRHMIRKECIMAASLQGFTEVSLTEPALKPKLTVTDSVLRFNKDTAKALGYPAYVKVFINERSRRIAIQPCAKDEPNAVKFSKPVEKQLLSISVKTPKVLEAVLPFFPLEPAPEGETSYKAVPGTEFPKEQVVIFDVADAVAGSMKHRGPKKSK